VPEDLDQIEKKNGGGEGGAEGGEGGERAIRQGFTQDWHKGGERADDPDQAGWEREPEGPKAGAARRRPHKIPRQPPASSATQSVPSDRDTDTPDADDHELGPGQSRR